MIEVRPEYLTKLYGEAQKAEEAKREVRHAKTVNAFFDKYMEEIEETIRLGCDKYTIREDSYKHSLMSQYQEALSYFGFNVKRNNDSSAVAVLTLYFK